MPRAALCSRCGMYQWVNADGTCASGHPAECLTNHHEVPVPGYPAGPAVTPAEIQTAQRQTDVPPRWVPSPLAVLAVMALALIAVVAWSGVTVLAHVDRASSAVSQLFGPAGDDSVTDDALTADSADQAADTVDPAADTTPLPEPASSVEDVAPLRKNTNPNVAAPALDAFIAKQYPAYRVEKRISFPNEWDKARLSVNYLLVNKKQPKFRLLVSVAPARKGEDTLYPDSSHYDYSVNGVVTDDGLFSANAPRLYGQLGNGVQDALVAAFAEKLPADSFVYDTTVDHTLVGATVEIGPKGLQRAMQDPGDNTSSGSASAYLPVVPGRDVLAVDITFDNP